MASNELQRIASYLMHETKLMNCPDNEDHTYSGIMFDIQAKRMKNIAVKDIQVSSISIRGQLGQVSVYTTQGSHEKQYEFPNKWTQVYKNSLQPSRSSFVPLEFSKPIILKPGETIGVYIHSTSHPGTNAIVYANQRYSVTQQDRFIRVLPGLAHTCHLPFKCWLDPTDYWRWRPNREFVGNISYGVNTFLWQPEKSLHSLFPRRFRRGVTTMLLCQSDNRCPLYYVPRHIVDYILNMCSVEWFDPEEGDTVISDEEDGTLEGIDPEEGISWHNSNYMERIEQHRNTSNTHRELYELVAAQRARIMITRRGGSNQEVSSLSSESSDEEYLP
mmetsp:Transcript_13014/g.21072  ORF Transcript_13014/g.21072 Transcript_13014/m.21072 type:complete len:331 (+) Transcript_13014:69-1061(+)